LQGSKRKSHRIAGAVMVWGLVSLLACTQKIETSRVGDYNDDGKIVIACLGDSNTCFGGASECGEMVDPWCHQLGELLPKTMEYGGREREIVILNFGWNGARAELSDVRDFTNKRNDRFRLDAQVAWATDLEARDREPRLSTYPRLTADVIVMAFGTNDYKALEANWWRNGPKPAWWPSPNERVAHYPRRPEEVSAALFRVMDRTRPGAPRSGELPLRAYLALVPPTKVSPERSHWDDLLNESIRTNFAARSLPAELLIDFSTGFGNPDYYGFKSYRGKTDRFHINSKGQAHRAALVREALCEDADHDCVPSQRDDSFRRGAS
jgi:lysophospholipase L1-like esterase